MRSRGHKKYCRCIKCIVYIRGMTIDTLINRIRNMYKKSILRNLKFNPQLRGRFVGINYLPRHYRDEFISVNEYKFQLVSCRQCHQIKKAMLNYRWSCLDCYNNFEKLKFKGDWTAWIGRSA